MSFSSDVKKELLNCINKDKHCQIAELASIICFDGKLSNDKNKNTYLNVESDNENIVKKYYTLVNKIVTVNKFERVSNEEAKRVLKTVKMLNEDSDILNIRLDYVDECLLEKSCCKRAFLRGAFITAGTISDPNKSYHFEIVCNTLNQADEIKKVMGFFDVKPKIVERKNNYVLYLKEGSQIAEVLNVMEAHKSLLDFENIRILKEMRNSVNRKVNCETANISKTINASVKQIEDIQLIEEVIGISNLPDTLREMATVRLEYPDVPLKDLGDYLSTPIGKSGVNHRLRRICEIADKIRK